MCYAELQKRWVDVITISVDSVNDHKVWNETELSKMVPGGVPFPMLEDRGGSIARLYDLYDATAGVSARASFLIDPSGTVQTAEFLTPAIGPNIAELLRQIKACQYHLATGDVIPANWTEGKMTLKPSIKMAGHVWEIWRPEKGC